MKSAARIEWRRKLKAELLMLTENYDIVDTTVLKMWHTKITETLHSGLVRTKTGDNKSNIVK